MKKLLVILLCMVMVLGSLSGCGKENSKSNDTSAVNDASTASRGDETATTEQQDAAAKAIADRKASGDYPTIVLAYFNWTGSPAGAERIQQLISKYTEEKLGIKFQLQIMEASAYNQTVNLMLASGEQVDIFNALPLGYTNSINNGYCLNLEQDNLIQDYGKGILSNVNETYINGCRVNDILYGLPTQRDMASGHAGFAIGKEYLDGIGYDYSAMYENDGDEIIYTDINTINDIFAKLHAKYPNIYVFAPTEATLHQFNEYDMLGGDNYGVLLDSENSLIVEDLWGSDMFKNFCKMMYQWNQAGYISKDALTDTTIATAQVKAGTAMAYAQATKPGIKVQESNLCGRDMIIFQTGRDMLSSGAAAGIPWCINSGTEDPTAAMQVLDLLYSDPYLSNLLCWGEEGKEYVKSDDGHITFADGVTAENSEYYNNVNWELPNQFIAHIWQGDSLDIWTRMDKFNNESVKSIANGFSFNNSSVSTEYTALTNVYKEYALQLIYGFKDPTIGIPEIVSKFESAGLKKYMEVKQAALDEWSKNQ